MQIDRKKIEFSGKTAFQDMDVMELGSFGRCLVLDNKLQSAQCDEFIYHEALVQPALLLHPNPKRVFIAGGGEGATAREILRHKSVEQVIMVCARYYFFVTRIRLILMVLLLSIAKNSCPTIIKAPLMILVSNLLLTMP